MSSMIYSKILAEVKYKKKVLSTKSKSIKIIGTNRIIKWVLYNKHNHNHNKFHLKLHTVKMMRLKQSLKRHLKNQIINY